MSRVFVIQNQQRRNKVTGKLYPAFNISPAEIFGTITYILGPSARPFGKETKDVEESQQNFQPSALVTEMQKKLKNYSDDDYLLLIGNPCFIGFAVAIASHFNNGRVRVLQWNGMLKKYIPVMVSLF